MIKIKTEKIKNKQAFTLAETLITLTIIGVIASVTIPLILDQQSAYKKGIKKAYNTLSNVIATEKSLNNLPADTSVDSLVNFFGILNNNMNISGYSTVDVGSKALPGNIYSGIQWGNNHYGSENNSNTDNIEPAIGVWSPWLIADDFIAYSILAPNNGKCENIAAIENVNTSSADAITNSCLVIAIDTNGLNKLPNTIEPQTINGFADSNVQTKDLTGDRYYLYLGKDGIATGSQALTLSGRLIENENK